MSTVDSNHITAEQLDIARRFALALDHEDYASAVVLLDAACVYTIHDQTFRRPDAILASYKTNGDHAAQKFDAITYGSDVRPGKDGWIVITFSDHIQHAGQKLDHMCEQWVRVDTHGKITRIEHHDLPGERERLETFKKNVGV